MSEAILFSLGADASGRLIPSYIYLNDADHMNDQMSDYKLEQPSTTSQLMENNHLLSPFIFWTPSTVHHPHSQMLKQPIQTTTLELTH